MTTTLELDEHSPKRPRYLGDGVYVQREHGMILLMTHDGVQATNVVYLEPEVWAALEDWVAEWRRDGGWPGA